MPVAGSMTIDWIGPFRAYRPRFAPSLVTNGGSLTVVETATSGAASHSSWSPGCDAVTVHVPAASRASVVPSVAQIDGVCTAYETPNPEDAVPLSAIVAPTYPAVGRVNVIVCDFRGGFTDIESWTSGAGSQVASPGWDAVTVHVPSAKRVSSMPARLQVDGVFEAKEMGRPEVAAATSSMAEPATPA